MVSRDEDQNDVLERRRSTGKWKQAGVPHKGWVSTGNPEYVGPDSETCEMCEVTEIRWVHHVSHPDYPEELRVGVVCAGNLTGDYEQAQQRERTAKNAKKRRDKAAAKKKERAERALLDQALAEIAAEKQRERDAIDLENRRAGWLSRKWLVSAKGNEYIREDGFVLTVFKKGKGWSGSVKQPGAERPRYLSKFHGTSDSAKLALFSAMIWLKDEASNLMTAIQSAIDYRNRELYTVPWRRARKGATWTAGRTYATPLMRSPRRSSRQQSAAHCRREQSRGYRSGFARGDSRRTVLSA